MLLQFVENHPSALSWPIRFAGSFFSTQCAGRVLLTSAAGSFSDGTSPSLGQRRVTSCEFLIQPEGASEVRLNFARLVTDYNGYIAVYAGNDTSESRELFRRDGRLFEPPEDTLVSSQGSMLVVLVRQQTTNVAVGFEVTYTSDGEDATLPPLTTTTTTRAPFVLQVRDNLTIEVGAGGRGSLSAQQLLLSPPPDWVEVAVDRATFSCSDVGVRLNATVELIDDLNRTSQARARIRVTDAIKPAVATSPGTCRASLNGSGVAVPPPAASCFTASDNCLVTTVSAQLPTLFRCTDRGRRRIALTVTDASENQLQTSFVVEVDDSLAPTITVHTDQQRTTFYLDADSGVVKPAPASLLKSSSDNCGISQITLSPPRFSCGDVGLVRATIAAQDAAQNTASEALNLTISDASPPTVDLYDGIVVDLGVSGRAHLSQDMVIRRAVDACGIASRRMNRTVFTCADVRSSAHPVSVVVTDNSGLSTTAHASVQVIDSSDPIIDDSPKRIVLDSNGTATTVPVVNDTCGVALIVATPHRLTCAHVKTGPVNVTVTVKDNDLTWHNTSFLATAVDDDAPTLRARAIDVQLNASGRAHAAAASAVEAASDNCAVAAIALDQSTFSCADMPSALVTLTAMDAAGNHRSQPVLVSVRDSLAPRIAALANVNLTLDEAGGATLAVADANVTATDNCAITRVALSRTSFTCGDAEGSGIVAVVASATDAAGNTATTGISVGVHDSLPPVAQARQGVTLSLPESGTLQVDAQALLAEVSDNCRSDLRISARPAKLACVDVGAAAINVTVLDPSGNMAEVTTDVDVVDTAPPMVTVKSAIDAPVRVPVGADGQSVVTVAMLATVSDNCGVAASNTSIGHVTCQDVGTTFAVTLSAEDINGNVADAEALMLIEDRLPPRLTLVAGARVSLDSRGQGAIRVADLVANATDNCFRVSLRASRTEFSCADLGTKGVDVTATDEVGNADTKQSAVTVRDTHAPTVRTVAALNVSLAADGTAEVAPEDALLSATDACGVVSLRLDRTRFSCADVGRPVANRLVAADASMNLGVALFDVHVHETIPPTVEVVDLHVVDVGRGPVHLRPEDVIERENGTCRVVSRLLSRSSFSCGDVQDEPHSVWLTLTTETGSNISAMVAVAVRDSQPPFFAPLTDPVVVLNGSGLGAPSVEALDRCGPPVTVALTPPMLTCADIGGGPVSVAAQAEDMSGNTARLSASVTVVDKQAPVLTLAQPADGVAVSLDAAGAARLSLADLTYTVSDNCDLNPDVALAVTSFSCADAPQKSTELRATDVSGNVARVSLRIRVEDTLPPRVRAVAGLRGILDGRGLFRLAATQAAESAEDNCGAVELRLSQSSFSCSDVTASPLSVTLTATDDSGNAVNASAPVQLELLDTTAPSIVPAQGVQVVLPSSCRAELNPIALLTMADDNCGLTLTSNPAEVGCATVGQVVVTVTATDPSGNAASVNVTVSVLPPVVTTTTTTTTTTPSSTTRPTTTAPPAPLPRSVIFAGDPVAPARGSLASPPITLSWRVLHGFDPRFTVYVWPASAGAARPSNAASFFAGSFTALRLQDNFDSGSEIFWQVSAPVSGTGNSTKESASAVWGFTVAEGPRRIVEDLHTPLAVVAGAPFSVRYTLRNAGDLVAFGPHSETLGLGDALGFDAMGTLICRLSRMQFTEADPRPLAPGEVLSRYVTLQTDFRDEGEELFATVVAPGFPYAQSCVVNRAILPEFALTSKPIRVTPRPRPNLVAAALVVAPLALTGATLPAQVSILNEGASLWVVDSATISLDLYLVPEPADGPAVTEADISAALTPVGRVRLGISALALPSSGGDFSFSFAIPPALAGGTYRPAVRLNVEPGFDLAIGIQESSLDDNVMVTEDALTLIKAPLPDFAPTAMDYNDEDAVLGHTLAMAVTVSNFGPGRPYVPGWEDEILVSSDASFSHDAIVARIRHYKTTATRQGYRSDFVLPVLTLPGSVFVRYTADVNGVVEELPGMGTANNALTRQIAVADVIPALNSSVSWSWGTPVENQEDTGGGNRSYVAGEDQLAVVATVHDSLRAPRISRVLVRLVATVYPTASSLGTVASGEPVALLSSAWSSVPAYGADVRLPLTWRVPRSLSSPFVFVTSRLEMSRPGGWLPPLPAGAIQLPPAVPIGPFAIVPGDGTVAMALALADGAATVVMAGSVTRVNITVAWTRTSPRVRPSWSVRLRVFSSDGGAVVDIDSTSWTAAVPEQPSRDGALDSLHGNDTRIIDIAVPSFAREGTWTIEATVEGAPCCAPLSPQTSSVEIDIRRRRTPSLRVGGASSASMQRLTKTVSVARTSFVLIDDSFVAGGETEAVAMAVVLSPSPHVSSEELVAILQQQRGADPSTLPRAVANGAFLASVVPELEALRQTGSETSAATVALPVATARELRVAYVVALGAADLLRGAEAQPLVVAMLELQNLLPPEKDEEEKELTPFDIDTIALGSELASVHATDDPSVFRITVAVGVTCEPGWVRGALPMTLFLEEDKESALRPRVTVLEHAQVVECVGQAAATLAGQLTSALLRDAGRIRLRVVADSEHRILDADRSNNAVVIAGSRLVSLLPPTATLARGNLVLNAFLSAESTVRGADGLHAGQPLRVRLSVANGGPGPLPTAHLRATLYLGGTAALGPLHAIQTTLTSRGAVTLEPGGDAQEVDFEVPMHSSGGRLRLAAPVGAQYLVARVSGVPWFDEETVSDNVAARRVTVGPPPELSGLRTSPLIVPQQLDLATVPQVAYSITNRGLTPVAARVCEVVGWADAYSAAAATAAVGSGSGNGERGSSDFELLPLLPGTSRAQCFDMDMPVNATLARASSTGGLDIDSVVPNAPMHGQAAASIQLDRANVEAGNLPPQGLQRIGAYSEETATLELPRMRLDETVQVVLEGRTPMAVTVAGVPSGEALRVCVQAASTPEAYLQEVEVLVRHKRLPSTLFHDARVAVAQGVTDGEPMACGTVANTRAGQYHIRLQQSRILASEGVISNLTLTARLRRFSLDSAAPASVGQGPVTLAVRGAKLHDSDTYALIPASSACLSPPEALARDPDATPVFPWGTALNRSHAFAPCTPAAVANVQLVPNPDLAYVRFDASAVPLGNYSLVVASLFEPNRVVLPTAITIEATRAPPPRLRLVNALERVWLSAPFITSIEVVNDGNVDQEAPLIEVAVENGQLRYALPASAPPGTMLRQATFLALAQGGGPLSTLRPGQAGLVRVSATSPGQPGAVPVVAMVWPRAVPYGNDLKSLVRLWRSSANATGQFNSAGMTGALMYQQLRLGAQLTMNHVGFRDGLLSGAEHLQRLAAATAETGNPSGIRRLLQLQMNAAGAGGPVESLGHTIDLQLQGLPPSLWLWREYPLALASRAEEGVLGLGWIGGFSMRMVLAGQGDDTSLPPAATHRVYHLHGVFDFSCEPSAAAPLAETVETVACVPLGQGAAGTTLLLNRTAGLLRFETSDVVVAFNATTGAARALRARGYPSTILLETDSDRRIVQLDSGGSTILSLSYDDSHRLVSAEAPDGTHVEYAYTGALLARVTRTSAPILGAGADDATRRRVLIQYTYGLHGGAHVLEEAVESYGDVAPAHYQKFYYDVQGRLERLAEGFAERHGEENEGARGSTGNACGMTTSDSSCHVYGYSYPAPGVVRATDPDGVASDLLFDEQYRLVGRRDAFGRFRINVMDEETGFRRMVVTNGGLQMELTEGADTLGRVTSLRSQPGAPPKQFAWFGSTDLLSSATSASGARTTFLRTPQGLLSGVVRPDKTASRFVYDELGRPAKRVSRRGLETTFAYTAARSGLVAGTQEQVPAEQGGGVRKVQYAYNGTALASACFSEQDASFDGNGAHGCYRQATDAEGRVYREQNRWNNTVARRFDARGQLSGISLDEVDLHLIYQYDERGRLLLIGRQQADAWHKGVAAVDPILRLDYRGGVRLKEGQYGTHTKQLYTHDATGALVHLEVAHAQTDTHMMPLVSRALRQGRSGRLVSASTCFAALQGGNHSAASFACSEARYGFTADGWLLRSQTWVRPSVLVSNGTAELHSAPLRLNASQAHCPSDVEVAYSDDGSRVSVRDNVAPSAAYAAGADGVGVWHGNASRAAHGAYYANFMQQYTQAGAWAIDYDADGNRRSQRRMLEGGVTETAQYVWGASNQLLRLERFYNESLQTSCNFTYDHVTVLDSVRCWQFGGSESFVRYVIDHSSRRVHGALLAELHYVNGALRRKRSFIRHDDAGIVAYEDQEMEVDGTPARPGPALRFLHYDEHGNVMAVTSRSGKLMAGAVYEPFGSRLWHVGEESAFPSGFQGIFGAVHIQALAELGLVRLHDRILDTHLGVFLSEEPAVQSRAGEHPYIYADNDPLHRTDQSGDTPVNLILGIAGALAGGGYEIYDQWRKGQEIDFGKVAWETGAGFVSGFVPLSKLKYGEVVFDIGKALVDVVAFDKSVVDAIGDVVGGRVASAIFQTQFVKDTISSGLGLVAKAGRNLYNAGKRAVKDVVDGISLELGRFRRWGIDAKDSLENAFRQWPDVYKAAENFVEDKIDRALRTGRRLADLLGEEYNRFVPALAKLRDSAAADAEKFFNTVATNIGKSFTMSKVGKLVADSIQSTIDTVVDVANKVHKGYIDLRNEYLPVLKQAYEDGKQYIGDKKEEFKNWVRDKRDQVIGYYEDVKDQVQGVLRDAQGRWSFMGRLLRWVAWVVDLAFVCSCADAIIFFLSNVFSSDGRVSFCCNRYTDAVRQCTSDVVSAVAQGAAVCF